MPLTYVKPFPQAGATATVVATTAVASLSTNTPSSTEFLLEAGENGTEVYELLAIPRATVTASSLLLFVSSDSGVSKALISSALMAAYTMAATTLVPTTTFALASEASPIRLAPGQSLYVGTQVNLAGGIVFAASYKDL